VSIPQNPYEAPTSDAQPLPLDDDERLLTAVFPVDQKTLYRTLRFEVERNTWFRRAAFVVSMLTLALLLLCLIFRLPFGVAVTAVMMFVLLHGLQLLVPHLSTRRALRSCERMGRWPITLSESRVEVSCDALVVRAGSETRRWLLADVADAFYLGDMLLICPEPGMLIPVPRGADFGGDTFASFCRTFAIRLKAE
jgi:hypothetical protein